MMLDAEDFFDLNDRAGIDEKTRERLGFVEEAAAISPEVHNDCVDATGFVLSQYLAAVDGCTDGVLVAAQQSPGVAVECGKADDTNLQITAAFGFGLNDLTLGVLFLELDFLASKLVNAFFLGPIGLDDQTDLGAARPSDIANHVVELLLDQVDGFAVFLDADNLIFRLKPAVLIGGHAWNDLGYDSVAILGSKLGADSLEREMQRLIEHVLPILGAQVGGVRIEGLGEVSEVGLEKLAWIDLVDL